MKLSQILLAAIDSVHPFNANPGFFVIMALTRNFSVLGLMALTSLRIRLNEINRALKNRECRENLKDILIVYDSFHEAVNLISKCFSAGFMINICQLVTRGIMINYNLFSGVMSSFTSKSQLIFIFGSIFIGPEVVLIMSSILCSAILKREASKTFTIIHRAKLSAATDKKSLKLIELASLQLEHQKSVVSCGLFSLDWNFLFAMFSSVVGFLLILIQFDLAGSFT